MKKKKINDKKFDMILKKALKENCIREMDALPSCEELDKIYKLPITYKKK